MFTINGQFYLRTVHDVHTVKHGDVYVEAKDDAFNVLVVVKMA